MQDHAHPNCVVMASQLIANIEWVLSNITEGIQDDSEKCVVERIQANLRDLASLKNEIEGAKQEQLRKMKELGQQHL